MTRPSPNTSKAGNLRDILGRLWVLLRHHPLAVIVYVGVCWWLWSRLGTTVSRMLMPAILPQSGFAVPDVFNLLWGSIALPPLVTVAIRLAREVAVSGRSVFLSLRQTPRVVAVMLVLNSPDLLARTLRDATGGWSPLWFVMLVAFADLLLRARMIGAVPLVVDTPGNAGAALNGLRWSWRATQGHTLAMLTLLVVPVIGATLLVLAWAFLTDGHPLSDGTLRATNLIQPLLIVVQVCAFMSHRCEGPPAGSEVEQTAAAGDADSHGSSSARHPG